MLRGIPYSSMGRVKPIKLSPSERRELTRRARSRETRADDARRARLILLPAGGKRWVDIKEHLECTRAYINKWNKRFRAESVEGLTSRKAPGGRPTVRTPEFEARVLAIMRQPPSDGSTHWSTRRLARRLGVSHTPGAPGVEAAEPQAASARAVSGVERPGFRAEGGGCDRPVSEPTDARRGVQRG